MAAASTPHVAQARRPSARLVWLIAGLLAAAVLKDLAAGVAVSIAASRVLGVPVRAHHCAVGILRQRLLVRGLEVGQPQGFGDGALLRVAAMEIRVDPLALLRGQLHVPDAAIDVAESLVVRRADGNINVEAVPLIAATAHHPTQAPAAPLPPFRIDRLSLHIGRVVFQDAYTQTPPRLQVYDEVLRQKIFKDITDARQFAALVLMQAMAPTALRSAGLSGAAMLSGAGFLPAAILGVIVAKDAASIEWPGDPQDARRRVEGLLKRLGRLSRSEPAKGELWGMVQGHDIHVRVERAGWRKSRISVAARRFLLPKPAFAAGLLYQLQHSAD